MVIQFVCLQLPYGDSMDAHHSIKLRDPIHHTQQVNVITLSPGATLPFYPAPDDSAMKCNAQICHKRDDSVVNTQRKALLQRNFINYGKLLCGNSLIGNLKRLLPRS